MFIASINVKAFPLAKYRSPGSADNTSRLFYEQNVSNLIRQLIDTQGFVVSGSVSPQGVVTDTLCFNLYGYYFELTTGTNLIDTSVSDSNYVLASITLTSTSPYEISGQDNNGFYEGLIITNSLNNTMDGIFIVLLEKDSSGNWNIPESSIIDLMLIL